MLEAWQDKPVYVCGRYRIDPLRRCIFIGEERVAVTAKAFDVLVELVQRAGRVVTKDELLSAVWPDAVVEENNLTQQISALRKLFNDPAGENKFIATVPGRGYCFAAVVNTEARAGREHAELLIAGSTTSSITIDISDKMRALGSFKIDPAALRGAALALVYVIVVCAAALVSDARRTDQYATVRSVGILTFRNVGSGDDRYGVGIRDTLRAKLGSLDDIAVRPEVIEPSAADTVAAGRRMNADIVLAGSVQRQDGRIRVAIEMVDIASERIIWGKTFDDDAANVFKLQDSIADEVIRSLKHARKGPLSKNGPRLSPEPFSIEIFGRVDRLYS